VWVNDKLAGSLICGFTISQEYKRNAAILPPGDLCWSFFPFGPKPDSDACNKHTTKYLPNAIRHLLQRDTTTNPRKKAVPSFHAWSATDKKLQNDVGVDDQGLDSVPDVLGTNHEPPR
jgi:hypothetical protein